jgi:hypothetical protein
VQQDERARGARTWLGQLTTLSVVDILASLGRWLDATPLPARRRRGLRA